MARPQYINIRNWEIQTQPKFWSAIGKSNNLVDLTIANMTSGSFIYIRDILFLYENTYRNLHMVLTDKGGGSFKQWKFPLERYNSKVGAAFFTDIMIKPVWNHEYSIALPTLPIFPDDYDYCFKVHYMPIFVEEWNRLSSETKFYMESRLLLRTNPFSRRHEVRKENSGYNRW